MNKIFNFTHKLIKPTFLEQIKNKSLQLLLKQMILEGYTLRIELGMSQEEFSEYQDMSLDAIKRIETGRCRNCELIEKYSNAK